MRFTSIWFRWLISPVKQRGLLASGHLRPMPPCSSIIAGLDAVLKKGPPLSITAWPSPLAARPEATVALFPLQPVVYVKVVDFGTEAIVHQPLYPETAIPPR